MTGRDVVSWTLGPDVRLEWPTVEALYEDDGTLNFLLKHKIVKELDVKAVKVHLNEHAEARACGGEAVVHIFEWHGPGGGSAGEGECVALKVYHLPDGRGGVKPVMSNDDARAEADYGRSALRKEVNILAILHHSGFADRVPPVLGIVRHWGNMRDPPLHGYAMPAYPYGSLAGLIRDTCDRRLPESVFADFFSPRRMAGEYSALMQVLSKLHTGERGLMLQDLSSNNLLVQDLSDDGCRLLLADPSMCFLISDLDQPDHPYFISTWLWGALAPRHKRFDPTADNYSLSMCFLELWLCAEGAPVPLFDLVKVMAADADHAQGHAFARALCVAILKRQACRADSIMPRVRREVPVSWLTLWLLLLGTEDFASLQQLESGQAHRRPAEADMVDAAAQLAAVTADVEALGGSLTAEVLATPAGQALVSRCLQLHERLTALSQLAPPKGSSLAPLDASLSWVATHFMAQEHPLVAAMRAAQGAEPLTSKTALKHIPSRLRTFRQAVHDAEAVADCDPYDFFYGRQQAIAARDKAEGSLKRASAEADSLELMLGHMCLEYGRIRDVALELLPSHPDRGLLLETGHLDPWLQQCINALCSAAGADAPPDAAAAQPPAAEPPACQPLQPGGPPPARPVAAGHHSMPPLRAAQRCVSIPQLHAASMPARPKHAPRPGAAALPPASIGFPASASGQPLQAAPAPAAPANLPAELTTLAAALLSGVAPGPADRLIDSQTSAAAAPMPANLPSQPALCSPAHPALAAAPSSSHLPGPSSAAAAAPRPPAASPSPSFLQQLPTLPAAAGGAASPSADLSSRTVAGGPGEASPATSGGSGVSSPNKRKRGAEQDGVPSPVLAAGAVLRFAVSRQGVLDGLPAFRLPPRTNGSNLYAYMVAQLSERFRGDVHQLLAQKQGPYSALLAAAGLQPAQLDSLVQRGKEGRYIEISAASFLPQTGTAGLTAAAPIIFHGSGRGLDATDQQIECGGGSEDERAAYSGALRIHLQECVADGLTQIGGAGGPITLLFRIAAAQLPQGAAGMPWVQHQWTVPAADLTAIAGRSAHLFRKKQ